VATCCPPSGWRNALSFVRVYDPPSIAAVAAPFSSRLILSAGSAVSSKPSSRCNPETCCRGPERMYGGRVACGKRIPDFLTGFPRPFTNGSWSGLRGAARSSAPAPGHPILPSLRLTGSKVGVVSQGERSDTMKKKVRSSGTLSGGSSCGSAGVAHGAARGGCRAGTVPQRLLCPEAGAPVGSLTLAAGSASRRARGRPIRASLIGVIAFGS